MQCFIPVQTVAPALRLTRRRGLRHLHACARAGAADEAVVRRTARLAQLDLSDAEVTRLAPEFRKILGFIDGMDSLDVEGVDPMARASASRNVLREDVPRPFQDVYVM